MDGPCGSGQVGRCDFWRGTELTEVRNCWHTIFLKLGGVGGPGNPNHQYKFQKNLTLFSCHRWLKVGGVRILKLTGDIAYYGHKLWWKDDPYPSKTDAVRSIYICCHTCQDLLPVLSGFWITTTEKKCWRRRLNGVQSSWNSKGSRILVILTTNPSLKKIWYCLIAVNG